MLARSFFDSDSSIKNRSDSWHQVGLGGPLSQQPSFKASQYSKIRPCNMKNLLSIALGGYSNFGVTIFLTLYIGLRQRNRACSSCFHGISYSKGQLCPQPLLSSHWKLVCPSDSFLELQWLNFNYYFKCTSQSSG